MVANATRENCENQRRRQDLDCIRLLVVRGSEFGPESDKVNISSREILSHHRDRKKFASEFSSIQSYNDIIPSGWQVGTGYDLCSSEVRR